MKICILSDSHDNRKKLHKAVEIAAEQGIEAVLHCGDLIGPSTIKVLKDFQIPVHLIHGNNIGDLFMLHKIVNKTDNKFEYHGQDASLNLAGKRIFMVHYPHYAQAMALTGDWDLVCYGHEHEVVIETVTNIKNTKTMLVNPGTVAGLGADAATFMIADLDTMEFTTHQVN